MENDIAPVVGHEFTFKAPPMHDWDGVVRCEVLEVVENERLAYSWRGGPSVSRIDTVVTFTLAKTASGGTRLVLEHSGFRAQDGFAFDGLGKGWRHMGEARLATVLAELA